MTDIGELGEFGLIGRIGRQFSVPDGVTGIGDDCAVIPQESGLDTLVSTDMLIEGTHFLREDADPYDLGWKSAAVNISDIAAMGGKPVATFLSLALPKGLDPAWVDGFIKGYRDLSAVFSCPLLGGDTTASPDRLCINVAVLGECPSGKAKKRGDARPGDIICVTGPLGDSAAGLKVILGGVERDADAEKLVRRHYRPMPRVKEGRALAALDGVHAMMDISDGIGSDLRHILEASGTGAEVDVVAIPLSPELAAVCAREGWDALDCAVSGGEDYELLFTAAPDADLSCIAHTKIGRITEDTALVWKGSGKDFQGFRHF